MAGESWSRQIRKYTARFFLSDRLLTSEPSLKLLSLVTRDVEETG